MNNEPELVDLGLPSGNLWFKCNLGAKSETDYGNYYQWGSLKGYQRRLAAKYSYWRTIPFKDDNEDNNDYGEYFKTNLHKWIYKNNNLKPEYDVVTQIYGKGFKMPNIKDSKELIDNTTTELIRNYKGTGITGRLFTSKINGKTLFIPFSGSVWNGSFGGIGFWGTLWSQSLHSNMINVLCLNCDNNYANLRGCDRCDGLTIRGIKEG